MALISCHKCLDLTRHTAVQASPVTNIFILHHVYYYTMHDVVILELESQTELDFIISDNN